MAGEDRGNSSRPSDSLEDAAPVRAPHDPEATPPDPAELEPDEVEDLGERTGLERVDPTDVLKRGRDPAEEQAGLDPTVGPIPPS